MSPLYDIHPNNWDKHLPDHNLIIQADMEKLTGGCNDKRKDNRVRKTDLFIVLSSNNKNYNMADRTSSDT